MSYTLGYLNIKYMWYYYPKFSFDCGLRPLNNDVDVVKFAEYLNEFKSFDIYVEHIIDDSIICTKKECNEYVES